MPDQRPACDLHLVVEIVRRAGIACEIVEQPDASPLIRARSPDSTSTAWTVHAGRYPTDPDRPAGAFVGPADSTRVRTLRDPDERRIAAHVVAQALHRDPTTVVGCDELGALGLTPAVLSTRDVRDGVAGR